MYVIKRTDKEYGEPKVEHNTLDEALRETERLAKKHAEEDPSFTIYELIEAYIVSSTIKIDSIRK